MTVVPQNAPHQVVAMLHVHSTTAILNTSYAQLLGIPAPSKAEVQQLEYVVRGLQAILQAVDEPLIFQVAPRETIRTIAFLAPEARMFIECFKQLPFVQYLVTRALKEAEIYVRNGISCVEIENVGAPYFLGAGHCPWEDLLAIYVITEEVRFKHASLVIGAHILSCNELEVLPIAIAHGCYFVRSEATLFHGTRPEGETSNSSNLARFFYVRNVLQTKLGGDNKFPMIWSDVLKKHTVFPQELQDIEIWLHNITFAKLEGVIVTGKETGSNVDEDSLAKARDYVNKAKQWNVKQFGHSPPLPVVTGSGLDFLMYKKYADFMIVGTGFKRGQYWENDVDEVEVAKVMSQINGD
jgi:predicted TIM-barrel enzyme